MEILNKKQTLLRPAISEKSILNYRNNRICTFWVDSKATKAEISYNFKSQFEIEPKGIRTVVIHDTTKKGSYTNRITKRRYMKKAYINIGENTLDIFENIK